ncbi:phospholipase D/nuclease [Nadsonia fulvescens var. elongata DSM 6958]|uniref:Phospholipase D/nuclease n=1 Tax=Nadsonia fulvescens var. elongata DSM 6958 TaxID=857566 RepID=A0A1E3PN91_9ASCO|nr:phospholipase D/nuclease [Nadsonia fulvescens var. elongata DSM 6958]
MQRSKRADNEVIVISDSDSGNDHDFRPSKRTRRDSTKLEKVTVEDSSPISLNRLECLSEKLNKDTDTLASLIGHDDLVAMWQFNFVFSLQFIMSKISPRARPKLMVNLIHGLEESPGGTLQAMEYDRQHGYYRKNIKFIKAKMPFRFGSHHTKMMVLKFTDSHQYRDCVQIIVHTANMIAKDWNGLTQGVWKSPMLERKPLNPSLDSQFEQDLLKYLAAYDLAETNELIKLLKQYDFSPIKAIFIASVPGYHGINAEGNFDWGAGKLRHVIRGLNTKRAKFVDPSSSNKQNSPKIIAQVSSIATLGPDPKYLYSLLCDMKGLDPEDSARQKTANITSDLLADLELIFPRVEDVRESLEGYNSGVSIHCFKYFSTQSKQYEYIRPLLRTWKATRAGRQRVLPHIKTYYSYDEITDTLNWYLLTSANLSKQAWGSISYNAKRCSDEIYIQSYECGVLLHAELFQPNNDKVGSQFQSELEPVRVELKPVYGANCLSTAALKRKPARTRWIPIRMAYDVPTEAYQASDKPWCQHLSYKEQDNYGENWIVQ